jgi:hypothetical protein
MRADMVVQPEVIMPKVIRMDGFGIRVEAATETLDPNNDVVSRSFIDQLQTEDDVHRIHVPTVTLDRETTAMVEERACEVLDGILPVRMQGWLPEANQWPGSARDQETGPMVPEPGLSPRGPDVMWRGAENVLFDLADRPAFAPDHECSPTRISPCWTRSSIWDCWATARE